MPEDSDNIFVMLGIMSLRHILNMSTGKGSIKGHDVIVPEVITFKMSSSETSVKLHRVVLQDSLSGTERGLLNFIQTMAKFGYLLAKILRK